MLRSRSLGAAALVLALSGSLAACGEDEADDEKTSNGIADMSPAEALTEADVTMSGLDDVTFTGFITLPGAGKGRTDVTRVITSGGSCRLELDAGSRGTATVVAVDSVNYVTFTGDLGDVLIGRASSGIGPGKWARLARTESQKVECLPSEQVPGERYLSTFKAGESGEVDGTAAKSFVGRGPDGKVTLWIATEGDPLLLQLAGRNQQGPYSWTTSGVDEGSSVTEPPQKDWAN